MRESKIQSEILRMVRHDWKWQAHKNDPSESIPKGWPDLSVYIPGGRLVLIETKKPGEGLSNVQRHVVETLINNGFPVYVCDNIGHATRVLRKEYESVCLKKSTNN